MILVLKVKNPAQATESSKEFFVVVDQMSSADIIGFQNLLKKP